MDYKVSVPFYDLPFPTPIEIMVDVANICNFRCRFCPTGNPDALKAVGRPKGIMDFGLFRKIVDGIDEFSRKVEILHLYKDGEPFLNKQLSKMIAYAKKRNVARSVQTTSNGSLIDKSKAIEIIEAGLDGIRISITHTDNAGYKDLTQTYSDYETIRKNVEFLFREKKRRKSRLKIYTKILDVKFPVSVISKFIKDFAPISDEISLNALMGWSLLDIKDFTLGLGVKTGTDAVTPLDGNRKVCPTPFYTLAVNFNGTVSVCCVDWSWNTIVGDARQENLFEIWNGKRMNEFRLLHLKGERSKNRACANCNYLQGLNNQLREIDDYSEYLTNKLTKNL